jgi:hypothetical protein
MLNPWDRLASPGLTDFLCWATVVSPTWGGALATLYLLLACGLTKFSLHRFRV